MEVPWFCDSQEERRNKACGHKPAYCAFGVVSLENHEPRRPLGTRGEYEIRKIGDIPSRLLLHMASNAVTSLLTQLTSNRLNIISSCAHQDVRAA